MEALLLAIFVLLLALSAFFSGSETALMTVDRLELTRRAREGDAAASLVLRHRKNPHRMLSALLVGNNLANTGAAALATAWAVSVLGEGRGVLVATVTVTLLLLVFSEVLPKTSAAMRPWSFSRLAARPVLGLQILLRPVVDALDLLTRPLVRWLGRRASDAGAPGAAEIRALIALAREGEVPGRILKIAERGLQLSQTTAEDIMVPRVAAVMVEADTEDIMVPRVAAVMVEADTTLEELVRLQRQVGHTRFPVFRKDPDETVGLLHISDVLDVAPEDWGRRRAGEIARTILQIPGTTPLHELLRRMQAQALHLAVVVDEYGGTDGIVTLEDVLEEIVGSIVDERDRDREAEVVRLGEGRLRVRGAVGLAFLAREAGVDLQHPHVSTVGGLIQHLVGRPARTGDRVEHRGHELRVERMTRKGVTVATIRRLPDEEAPEA
jgi:putative hemolysin